MGKSIKLIRLISGEELIAEVEDEQAFMSGYEIKKPVMLHMEPPRTPEGKPTIGFSPWMPYTMVSETGCHLATHVVAFMISVIPPLEAAYIQTVSGIALPPKKGLIVPS